MSRSDDRVSLIHYERTVLGHRLPGFNLAVTGMYSEEELDRSVEWGRRWHPLTAAEETQLLERRRIARSWDDQYGDPV